MSLGEHARIASTTAVHDIVLFPRLAAEEEGGTSGFVPAKPRNPNRDFIHLASLDHHTAELQAKEAKRTAMLEKIRAAKTEIEQRRNRIAGLGSDSSAVEAAQAFADVLKELDDLEQEVANGIDINGVVRLPSMANIEKAVTEARLKSLGAELNFAFSTGAAMADFTASMLENMSTSHVSQLTSRHFAQMSPEQLRAVSTSLQRHSQQFVGEHNSFMDRMARRGNIGDIQAFSREREAQRAAALEKAKKDGDFRDVYGYDIDMAAAGAAAAARVGDERDQAEAQRRLQEAKDRYVAENMRIAAEQAKAQGMDAARTQAHVDAARDRSRAEADQREQDARRELGAARERYIDETALKAEQDARARGLTEPQIRDAAARARAEATRTTETRVTETTKIFIDSRAVSRRDAATALDLLASQDPDRIVAPVIPTGSTVRTPVVASDPVTDEDDIGTNVARPNPVRIQQTEPVRQQGTVVRADAGHRPEAGTAKPLPAAVAEAAIKAKPETPVKGGEEAGHGPKTATVAAAAPAKTKDGNVIT